MQDVETAERPPKVRRKAFEYATQLAREAGRSGKATAAGLPDLQVSSPPEFRGEPGAWTPEHLFVSAIETCTMTTFVALAERAGLELLDYSSDARGRLEWATGGYRFSVVEISLRIRLRSVADRELAERVLHQTHEVCPVGRSVRAEVRLRPELVFGE
jgi:organic hydroperoxide reductase OsmC/OhrA